MTREKSLYYREARKKADILRDRYGGMMTATDLARELGYKDMRSAKEWAALHELPQAQVGRRKKYDTDQVAKALVSQRGMA